MDTDLSYLSFLELYRTDVAERGVTDKLAIKAVIEQYAYALDRRDVELMRSCFTSDADLSYLGGLRRYVGGDEVPTTPVAFPGITK